MKRIYTIWFFKKIAPAVFLYMPFLFFMAIRETAQEFFVLRIFDNFLKAIHQAGFLGGFRFVLSAIVNTPIFPTITILASGLLFVLILRKLFQNFRGVNLARSC